jgi:hypothetical protein
MFDYKRAFKGHIVLGLVFLMSGFVVSLLCYGILCFINWDIISIAQEGKGTRIILLGAFVIGVVIGISPVGYISRLKSFRETYNLE